MKSFDRLNIGTDVVRGRRITFECHASRKASLSTMCTKAVISTYGSRGYLQDRLCIFRTYRLAYFVHHNNLIYCMREREFNLFDQVMKINIYQDEKILTTYLHNVSCNTWLPRKQGNEGTWHESINNRTFVACHYPQFKLRASETRSKKW